MSVTHNESCSCGAKLSLEAPDWYSATFGVGKFHAAHKECRPAVRPAAEHERFVRCSIELVDLLKARPSAPVTIQIEEREHGELSFIAKRHDCPEADPKPAADLQQNGNGNEKGAGRSAPEVG